jgi:2-polyprenyl-6-methoxyphenol hydroxylase-like FAD-dependent oxidoreductase
VHTEVIVVGAGPTGLMLAYELTLAGISVVVLEKQQVRSTQSRADALQPRTAEVLDLRGLLEPLLERTLSRGEFSGHFAGLPVELDCRLWRTRYLNLVALPQARLEAFLEERLFDQGVPILRGHEVTAVEQNVDGVTVGDIRGSYLVACDGAHSTIRTLLGAPFPGSVGRMSFVAADITLLPRPEAAATTSEHDSQYYKSSKGIFTLLYPLDDGLHRFIFGKVTNDSPDHEAPVTDAEVREVLQAVYGTEKDMGELRVASRFSDATRQIERYRKGRVFFAGDAAHVHLPIGGQGVNLGIQDAFNLGWKLAAAVHGWAPQDLLDSYHTERHPVGARVLHHTRAQRVLINASRDENVAAVRDIFADLLRLPETNRHIAGMMSGLDIHYPGLGPRMIDVDLTTSEGPTRVSQLMHSGRGLLLSFDDTPRSIGGWSDRVEHVRATTDEDIDFESVLIRPDGYIAWKNTDEQSLEATLIQWFG